MSHFAGRVSHLVGVFLAGGMLFAGTGCAMHPKGPHGPVCTTIEAATTIQFASDRQQTFGRIASKGNLSQHEQTYLVNVICLSGGYADDQATALIALIKNPSCTPETREYVAKHLQWIALSDARRRVAEAMIDNPPAGQPSGS